jgi:hypothetical protein
MKRYLVLIVLLGMVPISLAAQNRGRDEGVIIRMRVTDCIAPHHVFMTAMAGPQASTGETCPEYVLLTERVVYVIVGKSADQLLPLAETTRFRFQSNEILIRIEDARRESHFHVKAMTLRPEWERNEQIAEAEAVMAAHRRVDGATLVNVPQ